MKTKRKQRISLGLIFLLIVGLVCTPIGQVVASDSQPKDTDISSGFIIETAKVDGAMDLVGALTGNITIWEGQIDGLTITKVVERGNLEPLVVRIKAPGPIPVENLQAQTVGHELPNIGGLCKPSKLGWICMENVVMNVDSQFVEHISLVDATVETCYLSECGALPEYNPMVSLEELKKLLQGDEKLQDLLQQIIDLLNEQELNLEQVKEIITSLTDILSEIGSQDYPGVLLGQLSEVEKSITNKLGLDGLPVNDIKETINHYADKVSLIAPLLEKVGNRISGLDSKVPKLEEMLTEYEGKLTKNLTAEKQLEVYEQLVILAERQKAGVQINAGQLVEKGTGQEKEDQLERFQQRFNKFKRDLAGLKERYDMLLASDDTNQSEYKEVNEEFNRLMNLLEKLKLKIKNDNLADDLIENTLEPVTEKVLEPVEEKVLQPVEEKVLTPVLEPVKENIIDPVGENIVDPILDPVEETILDPVTENVLDPVLDPVLKPLDPVLAPIKDTILNPLLPGLLENESEEKEEEFNGD